MKNSLTIDSLSEKMELQTQYMVAIRSVMSDEIKADSTSTIDSLRNKVVDFTTLHASEKEVTFRDSFEKSERLNINVLEADVSGSRNFLMKRPVNGVLMDSFNIQNKSYGVKIITEQNSNIFSILDGVVVESQFVLSNQYVMSIQHADNMISVYKSKQPFLKKKGDRLRAGEIISTLRDSSERVVEFELWEGGVPLNPKEYISF
jgi:murein DD-endopeptidase MepM/ murein hydrolase activator NlpD